MMSATPTEIITEARTWLGTPYRHQGRTKGIEIDCIGLPICVAQVLRLKPAEFFLMIAKEYRAYSRASLGNSLYNACKRFVPEVLKSELQPSDIVLFLMDKELRHAGILTKNNTIIHAYAEVGKCVEHVYSKDWQLSTYAVFRMSAL